MFEMLPDYLDRNSFGATQKKGEKAALQKNNFIEQIGESLQ